ncbi:2-hydroxyacid dehydrogenase [Sphingosinicella rhizophila]|uniref:D-glycerate dehydrogenase n=1 Tax=Sphingosinicella rhizophila TaxID=3050082 RepID=A0ABU3Q8L9_9SPHN|nr:D-glycerate dehydrogenase [Sphingosinicella sp. GR2756]MDT9599752.1 D-glycerate dehydrogenase [Sphingosinicella sp. GR2756]
MSGRPRVLLTRRWPEAAEQEFQRHFEVTLNTSDRPMTEGELAEAMSEFDAVCPTVSDTINATVLAGRPRASLLANFGVGFNHIDIGAARAAGVAVTNTPGVLTDATAEIALLLILMTARRAGEAEREVRARRWAGWRPTHMLGASVTGKTLGLIGFGRIAQATAERARLGFGMTILYHARRRAPAELEERLNACFCENLDELLASADFVSLHVPGGEATHHLVNANRLKAMKPGSFLINTARGDVVDEQALLKALENGPIAGAGLDVYANEPSILPEFTARENVVLLPHIGSATAEARVAMGLRAFENVAAFFEGRTVPDRVV